jgi:hypothetical protein
MGVFDVVIPYSLAEPEHGELISKAVAGRNGDPRRRGQGRSMAELDDLPTAPRRPNSSCA